jgi:RNA polymerase sigma-70 factor, ECF subfamily
VAVPGQRELVTGRSAVCDATAAMVTETSDLSAALGRASAGDEAGFLELWRALQPRLLRFLRVLRCEDPDDVASETWLQVVRDLRSFAGDEQDFRRWLFTIARHRAIDAARARSRRPAAAMSAGLDILADVQIVEDQVLDALSARQAVAMLGVLSPDQAEAVALRVIAGLETPDVARILGKSAGAVRVALHRGLRALASDPSVRALAGRDAIAATRPATDMSATVAVPGADPGTATTQPKMVLPAFGERERNRNLWTRKEEE